MASEAGLKARAAMLAVAFLSGLGGLAYPLSSLRELAVVFGDSAREPSPWTGAFLAGLGVGGLVLGRAGERRGCADRAEPLRLFARVELALAGLGLLLALLLPHLGALSAVTSFQGTDSQGWHEPSVVSSVLRLVVALVLVAPGAFLTGGAFTLLVGHLVASDPATATRRLGAVCAASAAGAAVAALAVDLLLVPTLGHLGTQLVSAAASFWTGLFALALARRVPAGAAGSAPASAPPAVAPASGVLAGPDRELRTAALALLLAGFGAMGLEVLWLRLLSGILGDVRVVLALLLAVTLAGIALGAPAGAWLHRRYGRPALLLLAVQCLLAATTLGLLGLLDHRALAEAHLQSARASFAGASTLGRGLLATWIELRPVAVAAGLPALLMGASFPLANAGAHRGEATSGGRAGALYLAAMAGSALACAVVAPALLPAFGLQGCAALLAACAAAGAVPVYLAARGRVPEHVPPARRLPGEPPPAIRDADLGFAAFGGLAAVSVAAFLGLPGDTLGRQLLPAGDDDGTRAVLAVSEGPTEMLAVLEVPGVGRELFTTGSSLSSTLPTTPRARRAAAHLPLLQLDAPERVLVLGFGIGSTLHAASLHPTVKRLELAEPSSNVLDQADWFAGENGQILGDPRVAVFVVEGRRHLLAQPGGSYDLIAIEPPPGAVAGVSALYSRELYELARSRLTPGGYLTQGLPTAQATEAAARSVVRAFAEVFPESVLLSGDDGHLLLMGTTGPSIRLDREAFERRQRARPLVQADLARHELGDATEVAGTFVADHATMLAASNDTRPLTDDRPLVEGGLGSRLGERRRPAELVDATRVESWCAGCLARLPRLAGYLRLRGLLYASDALPGSDPSPARATVLAWTPAMVEAMEGSATLRGLLGGPSTTARQVGLDHLAAGRWPEAVGAFRRALFHDPTDAESLEGLARAYAGTGEIDAAAFSVEHAVKLAPRSASKRFLFAWVLRELGVAGGAVEQYRAGLALDPADADARYEMGVVLQALGKREEAEQELRGLLADDPAHPRANLVWCKRAVARGDLEGAAPFCHLAEDGGVDLSPELRDKLGARGATPL